MTVWILNTWTGFWFGFFTFATHTVSLFFVWASLACCPFALGQQGQLFFGVGLLWQCSLPGCGSRSRASASSRLLRPPGGMLGGRACEGVPSRPPTEGSDCALPWLVPSSPPALGCSAGAPRSCAGCGVPAHLWRQWEERPGSHSLRFRVCKTCNLFKNKSTRSACIRIALRSTNFPLHMKMSLNFFPTKSCSHLSKTHHFFFCGVAVSQHLTSFGQNCQSSLGKGRKGLSSQPAGIQTKLSSAGKRNHTISMEMLI